MATTKTKTLADLQSTTFDTADSLVVKKSGGGTNTLSISTLQNHIKSDMTAKYATAIQYEEVSVSTPTLGNLKSALISYFCNSDKEVMRAALVRLPADVASLFNSEDTATYAGDYAHRALALHSAASGFMLLIVSGTLNKVYLLNYASSVWSIRKI